VVLADAGALGRVAAARFAGPRELDALITDRGADLAQVEPLRALGLEIRLA
jgi:DeoR/GlpR family transcriptional regulator of sugar metabolism